ncbi:hypothetical protein A2U01_0094877, partial [Trifolium medium]|nr:hypothetical protein [Trifolium medium]
KKGEGDLAAIRDRTTAETHHRESAPLLSPPLTTLRPATARTAAGPLLLSLFLSRWLLSLFHFLSRFCVLFLQD